MQIKAFVYSITSRVFRGNTKDAFDSFPSFSLLTFHKCHEVQTKIRENVEKAWCHTLFLIFILFFFLYLFPPKSKWTPVITHILTKCCLGKLLSTLNLIHPREGGAPLIKGLQEFLRRSMSSKSSLNFSWASKNTYQILPPGLLIITPNITVYNTIGPSCWNIQSLKDMWFSNL